jgi:teichuronic acid biosynthesis glycosyltransferase TuaC
MKGWEMCVMQTIDSMPTLMRPHVLVVSNHWGAKKSASSAGIFVDRQIASLEKAGVRISTFDIGTSHSPRHILTKWLELRRLVQRLNPDLVHAQYGTIVGFVSAFVSKPAIISYCGNDLRAGASVSKVRMYLGFLLSNMAALRARALICKSAQLRQALWWSRHRAVVIPSGVDLDLFSPGPQEIARKQLGWEIEHPIVIFNVRNDPKNKGLDLATTAMQMVRSRIPGTELRLVENVEPNRMPLYYRAADALLCASLSEGSPNVVKEALACNLPVISTPVGDVPERLAGVQPSAVVARDAKAIGEALVQVLLERKRSNGREHVASLRSENISQRVLDVYRTALCDSLDDNSAVDTPRAEELTVFTITDGDMLQDVAGLHLDAFAGHLNTLLGRGYAQAFIKWFIKYEGAIAIAAIDGRQKIVGYALGAPVGYTGRLNRELFWGVAARIIMRPWVLLNSRFWIVLIARMRSLMGLPQNARQVLELPEPSMSLVAIGVASSQRRSKIGQRLMRAFEAGAREFQMRSLVLSVYENGTAARRFYEKCGWQPYDGQVSKGGVIRYFKILQSDHPDELPLSKTIGSGVGRQQGAPRRAQRR